MPREARPAFVAVVAGCVAVVLLTACGAGRDGSARRSPAGYTENTVERSAAATRTLGHALDADVAAHPAIPGEAAAVLTPDLDVSAAAGWADPAARTLLTPDTPFRIASVTKTFVAVAALRLVEQGTLSLDAAIGPLVSPETAALLESDGYDLDRITLRELLDHTAGLSDFAGSDAYDDVNTAEPGHHWTRAEQLRFAVDHGDPIGEPGERYRYDDTGYVIVGELIERATGRTLPQAVRDLDGFARLGLDHTWWESLEPAPPGEPARAHQFAGKRFDNATLDASADLYGGGGLVSTVGDVARFFDALFAGKVFDHDATLDAMLTVSDPGRKAGAALGIFATRVDGVRCWGHPGWWGTVAEHCPSRGVTYTLTVNQADESLVDTAPVEHTILGLSR